VTLTVLSCVVPEHLLLLAWCMWTTEAVGTELQNEEWARVLLTPLIHRWNITRDDDEIALPALIECMVFVISAVGQRIKPCAAQIYSR
jgi:hypothetical protein